MRDTDFIGGISWTMGDTKRDDANRREVESSSGMGSTSECEGSPVVPRLRQLLPAIRLQVRRDCTSFDRVDKEGCNMAVGSDRLRCIREVEESSL